MWQREKCDCAKMGKQVIFLLAIWCTIDFVFAGNDSNIQRVNNRLKKVSEIVVNGSSFNSTARGDEVILADEDPSGRYVTNVEDQKDGMDPLVPFSKNNPELDWKKPLKMATSTSTEKPKDLDVDFMIEKLQKTANSIQWLVDLYDPLRWRKVPGNLQEDCKRDMEWFLRALKEGKIWAAKCEFGFILKVLNVSIYTIDNLLFNYSLTMKKELMNFDLKKFYFILAMKQSKIKLS